MHVLSDLGCSMRTLTVQWDDREKAGRILFPEYAAWRSGKVRIEAEKVRLKVGDYRLKQYKKAMIIERKGSPMELYDCLLGTRVDAFNKQLRAIQKKCVSPALLLTCNIGEVLTYPYAKYARGATPDSGQHVLNMLAQKCIEVHRVNVYWGQQLRSTNQAFTMGHVALSLMLGAAEKFGKFSLTGGEEDATDGEDNP